VTIEFEDLNQVLAVGDQSLGSGQPGSQDQEPNGCERLAEHTPKGAMETHEFGHVIAGLEVTAQSLAEYMLEGGVETHEFAHVIASLKPDPKSVSNVSLNGEDAAI